MTDPASANDAPVYRDPPGMTARAFKAAYARGGGPWTMTVNQHIGAIIAMAAIRRRITPNQLTLASLVSGAGTSAAVLFLHSSLPIVAGLIGVIGWQTAYSCDCADGQVARATRSFSEYGAMLDLVVDFFIHVSTALVIVTAATSGWETGVAAFSVFVISGWLMPIYYEGITGAQSDQGGSRSVGFARRVLRAARDYGLHIAAIPSLLAFNSRALAVVVAVIVSLHYAQFIWRSLLYATRG